MFFSCKKTYLQKESPEAKMQSSPGPLQIDMQDIYKALPQTIMYNLWDRAKLYVNNSSYQYVGDDLVVKIPTNESGLDYIFAAKRASDPDKTLVYLVRYFPERYSSPQNYSGELQWINLQDGQGYGIRYENNSPVQYLTVDLFSPGDEQCWLDNGGFGMDESGRIVASENEEGQGEAKTMRGPYDCPNNVNKRKGFLQVLGNLIANLFDNDGSGSSGGGGGGSNWIGGLWDGNSNNWPPGSLIDDHTGGGGGGSTPPSNNTHDNTLIPSGGTGTDPNEWPPTQVPDPENPSPIIDKFFPIEAENPVGFGLGKDENGFYYSKITALQAYVQSNPYGMLDCNDINNMPMPMMQEIGSYQVSQFVLDRIQNIINTNSPAYTSNNTFIQDINDGVGVINMDYFPVQITQLPKKSNGQTMSPLEFLEFFRKNITPTFTSGNSATFEPFTHYVAGSINIDETFIYNSNSTSSLGSWVHIHIPINESVYFPMRNNGTVVLSNYFTNFVLNDYYFTFTTLATLKDGTHPVAGNRRFGMKPDPNGGWVFYISGVDRCYGWYMLFEGAQNSAFTNADILWQNIQNNVVSYIINNQGFAGFYSPMNKKIRVNWEGAVKSFLKGEINLNTLKALLGCL